MLLSLTLLGILYLAGLFVMVFGLANAQPETAQDADLAAKARFANHRGDVAGRPAVWYPV